MEQSEGTVRAQIGEGVTVSGPESLVREALEIPEDRELVPFLAEAVAQAADQVRFSNAAALCDIDPEAETKPDPFPVGRRLREVTKSERMAWRNHPDGSVSDLRSIEGSKARGRFIPPPTRCVLNEPRYVPGQRVWDVGTEAGPWVLIRPTTLKLPVELPPEPEAYAAQCGRYVDPAYDAVTYRGIEVNAWVVEIEPWRFQTIPEACLSAEAPLRLSEELLAALEAEAEAEAMEDAEEVAGRELLRSDVLEIRDEVRRLRARFAYGVAAALAVSATALAPMAAWLAQHIR